MVRLSVTSVVLSSLVAFTGCSPAPPPPSAAAPPAPVADAPADIAALNAARKAFMAAYEAGDVEAIGKLYAADAISEPDNQPTLKGRDAIVASLKVMFERVKVKPDLQPEETKTLGTMGVDRGRYIVTVTPKAGGTPTSSEGRYLVLFVKEADGTWRVWRDIDNDSVAPPEAKATADDAAKNN